MTRFADHPRISNRPKAVSTLKPMGYHFTGSAPRQSKMATGWRVPASEYWSNGLSFTSLSWQRRSCGEHQASFRGVDLEGVTTSVTSMSGARAELFKDQTRPEQGHMLACWQASRLPVAASPTYLLLTVCCFHFHNPRPRL